MLLLMVSAPVIVQEAELDETVGEVEALLVFKQEHEATAAEAGASVVEVAGLRARVQQLEAMEVEAAASDAEAAALLARVQHLEGSLGEANDAVADGNSAVAVDAVRQQAVILTAFGPHLISSDSDRLDCSG